MIVDLARAKEHLRITGTDEDALLEIYVGAAEDWIKNYLDDDGNIPDEFAIKAAALLILSGLYEHREAQVAGVEIKENPAVERLLFPFRKKLGV